MFNVRMSTPVKIAECPENGIAAVRWREEHGLPVFPTNEVRIEINVTDRAFCEHPDVAAYLDYSADINLYSASNALPYDNIPYELRRETPVIPVSAIPVHDVPTTAELLTLWRVLLIDQRARFACAVEAGAALSGLNDAQLGAEFLPSYMGVPEWLRAVGLYDRVRRCVEELRERLATQEREQRERWAREQAEKERAQRLEIEVWAAQHGSSRLRRLLTEDIECGAVYRSERRKAEYPGWRDYITVRGDEKDPRNPPETALDFLDEARASCPLAAKARLAFWMAEDDYDAESGDRLDEWRGYVAMIEDDRLGVLVYGGPGDPKAAR